MATDCIVGLDIGTTKVCAIVAEVDESGVANIIGLGHSPSHGIRKGVVIDIDGASLAIEDAVTKARRMTGYEIHSVVVGVTGEHIASLNSRGVVAVTHPSREITVEDLERVQDQARVIVLPPDREIIHAIPRSYSIDGQGGIRYPVGMSGTRLEVETHIVTGAVTFIQNVAKCVHKAGLSVEATVLEPIATGEAVLLPAERDLGVILADIGGGTTDIAIFVDGDILYSAVIPVGGNHVTRDISVGLRVSHEEAERVKLKYGACLFNLVGSPELDTFEVTPLGFEEPRPIPRRILVEIIHPRMDELFTLVRQEIMKSGYYNLLPAGVVLSGGGSEIAGGTQLCQQVTGMPTRIGAPRDVVGLSDALKSPIYATGVGLVLYGVHHAQYSSSGRDGYASRSATGIFRLGSFMKSIQAWFARHMGVS
ncbi:MAG TPA: cell division protein FtsA [Capsulimonadaceae bacterium]|nr:cell division protein FtsA [Capsulimonadaceae bacterium]